MSDWTQDLIELIFTSSFMTLATADADGLPWASPVEFACDDALRFYWTSLVDARHSQNIRANPRAALSIYDSTQPPGVHATAQGLYAEGAVEELDRQDQEAVLPSLGRWTEQRDAGRAERASRPAADQPDGDSSRWRFYRLTPAKLYALDPAGHPDFPGVRVSRVQLDLAESFARVYRSRLG